MTLIKLIWNKHQSKDIDDICKINKVLVSYKVIRESQMSF